jgi:ABC-type transport system substrate-binding protein
MMSKRRKIVLAVLVLGSLALTAGILLAPSAYEVTRYVIAGGGSRVQGTNYGVISTMGQGAVGSHGAGANYGACAGYWCGGLPEFKVFLPLVLRAS